MLDFATEKEFLDVGCVPVTIGAGPHATPWIYCAAWDSRPPRRFPLGVARSDGAAITRKKFLELLSRAVVTDGSQRRAPPREHGVDGGTPDSV